MTLSERGAQIREARRQQGLSRYRAAIKARVHPNSVALAELGATSQRMLERIAKALGLPEQQP
jgi:transcriptional regulator with XRE-family HTH domain